MSMDGPERSEPVCVRVIGKMAGTHRNEPYNVEALKLTEEQWNRIQRYVTGVADSEETRWVEEMMIRDSVVQSLVEDLKAVWSRTPDEPFYVDVDRAWETFDLQTRYRPYLKPVRPGQARLGKPRRRSRVSSGWVRAAAMLLVAVVSGYLIHFASGSMENRQTADADPVHMQEMRTDQGEKARITFSDGTAVTLNSGSTIRFPNHFSAAHREVYLEGEAYFSVSRAEDHPFLVHAGDLEVEVLGTEFNVRSHSVDQVSEVAVREGRVAVRSAGSAGDRTDGEVAGVQLQANQFIRVPTGTEPSEVIFMDVERALLWTAGGLYFEDTRFDRVIRDLERRFGVSIQLEGIDATAETMTGTFYHADLNEVLSIVATTMRARVEREGTEVHLRRNVNGPDVNPE